MPILNLTDQPLDELSIDDKVTELSISQQWVDMHNAEEIQALHGTYNQLEKLDLSGIDIGHLSLDKIKAIIAAFPKVPQLLIDQNEKTNAALITELMEVIAPETELSLVSSSQNSEHKKSSPSSNADQEIKHQPDPHERRSSSKSASSEWSFFSPSSWFTRKSEEEPVQHHDTTRVPFDLTKFNTAKSNILADWNRAFNEPVLINNMPMKDLFPPKTTTPFSNMDELRKFFKSHLLLKLDLDKIGRKKALDYLMAVLHQGGLQHPVAAPLYVFMAAKSEEQKTGLGPVNSSNVVNGIPGQDRVLSFTATDTGFTVTETITQNRLAYDITAGDKAGEYLVPDKGCDYVLEMTATIDVSWPETSSTPTVNVIKTGTTYGSAEAKSLLDDRTYFQTWYDNGCYLLGYNAVTVLEHEPPIKKDQADDVEHKQSGP